METSTRMAGLAGRKLPERIDAPQLRTEWRNHFNRNKLHGHHSYNKLEKAYRFGSEMADSVDFQGRDWNAVVHRVKARWLAVNEPISWIELNGAIRCGFESYQQAV